MNNTTFETMKQLLPQEIMSASIWVAWGARERNGKGKVAKTLVNPRGMLGFYAGWQDEDCETFDGAIGKLNDAWEDDWISGGIGIHNIERANIVCVDVDNVHLDVAIALHAQVGGILERSPSGNGYHIWGAGSVNSNQSYQTAVGGCAVGVEVIGAKGKWCTMTCDVIAGVWGELRLPEPVSGSKGLSVSAPVAVLREAFLGSTKGNRHDALYKYCRGLQASLIAIGEADESIYYSAVEKAVKAHSEYLEGGEAWQWLATAKSVWKSTPYSETVDAHKVQTGAVFEVIEPEEVQKLIEESPPVKEKKKRNLFADGDPYLSLIQEVYQPKKLVRDIFNRKAMMLIEESETEKERWVSITDTSVEQTLKAAVGRLGAEDRVNKSDILANLYWLETRGIDWGLRVNPPAWDGVDRLAVMAHSLNPKDKRLTPEVVEYFIKDWIVRAVSRMHDHTVSNRVLLFQGAQKIGKDEFFRTLTNGFGPYYIEPSLPNKFKISEEILARSIFDKAVCLFDEFDKLEGSEAIFKSLVTKQELAFDQKFERNIQSFKHRCSYIASCNPAKILKDSTGNRRFVLIQLEGKKGTAIRFNFPYGADALDYGEQILAQGFALREEFGDGLPEVKEFEAIMEDILEAHTPVSEEATVMDAFREVVENYCHDYNREFYVWKTMTELKPLLIQVAEALEMEVEGVRKLLEDAGAVTSKNRKLRVGSKTVRWHGLPEVLGDRDLLARADRHDWGSRELDPQKVEHGLEIVTAFPKYKQ